MRLILSYTLLFLAVKLQGTETITNETFLKDWIAYSENHMALSGDLTVKASSIIFKKHGEVSFKVIKASDSEYILELDKEVDSGVFMRIGPIGHLWSNDYTDMEVAYYETAEKALLERPNKQSNATSWGIYTESK
jgi:hypothetical protein